MPIVQSELKFYKSETVSDTDSNGGRMSASEIPDDVVNNVFRSVGESERTAGGTKYRKIFAKNANAADLALAEPKVFLDQFTEGDDRVTLFIGDQTNIQDDITGSETKLGCGKLDANASATDTEIDVLVEDGATQFFQNGQKIRITDMADVDDDSGNEEYVTIDGAPSVVGDVVTLTITPALAFSYSASDSRVMNVYEPADDVVATAEDLVVTSAAGTFDVDNLLAHNVGGVEDDWTLTFTSGTAFNIVGANAGAQGAGSIGAGAAPNNSDFSAPFFTLQAAGFGGTFLAGDTIEFTTHPAAVAIWMKRIVPAGTAPFAVNRCVPVLDGESSG
jgi:hypothetical protein